MSTVWEQLVGQEAAVDVLRAASTAAARMVAGEQDTSAAMTHSWLFTGPPGSGRSTAARAFAAALQCTTVDAAGPRWPVLTPTCAASSRRV